MELIQDESKQLDQTEDGSNFYEVTVTFSNNKGIIGFGIYIYNLKCPFEEQYAFIEQIYVYPKFRRSGYASKILSAIEKKLQELFSHCETEENGLLVRLIALPFSLDEDDKQTRLGSGQLIDFYEKHGYKYSYKEHVFRKFISNL